MAEEKVSSVIDMVSGDLINNLNGNKELNTETLIDPEEIKKQMEAFDNPEPRKKSTKKDPDPEPEEEIEEEEDDEEVIEDEEEVDEIDTEEEEVDPEDIKPKVKGKSKKVNDVDIEETELVSAFTDLFAEELGWDVDDKTKPKSTKELVKYMQDIIEYNSTPKYSSDQIKELDEFVSNGGDVKDFFDKVYSSDIDIDKLDVENETDQKLIVEQNLLNRGYSKDRIKKLISRYEEAGSLEEEATDSLAEVKEYVEKNKKQLLEDQKKQSEAQKRDQLKFVQDVEKLIKDTSSIMGYKLNDKDKQELLEGIFRPGKDGLTNYQREYNKDMKNLVNSAFFTLKGDALVKSIKKEATTNAVNNLKQKIRSKGKSTKNTESEIDDSGNTKISSLWEIASRDLIKK